MRSLKIVVLHKFDELLADASVTAHQRIMRAVDSHFEDVKPLLDEVSLDVVSRTEYKSIKHDFLAKTSSKDYRVRLFYFVFVVLLYSIWWLTDFLLKAGADVR